MFADTVAELKVLMKHGSEGERNGLRNVKKKTSWEKELCSAYLEEYVGGWRR